MKKLILTFAAAAVLMPAAKAFTVHDLVKENGIYAIDRLYWSKWDALQGFEYTEWQFEGCPFGDSRGLHFEYVRDLNDNIMPTKVKLAGMRGFNWDMAVVRDFIFFIVDDNNNPVEDGTKLVSKIDWDSHLTGSLSSDNTYYLAAGRRSSEEYMKEMYENYGYMVQPYSFPVVQNVSYGSASVKYWEGKVTKTERGLAIDFDEPGAFIPCSKYPSLYYFNRAMGQNADHIIDSYHLETYEPDGWFTCKEYAYNKTTEKYSTTGVDRSFPLMITANGDGTLSILNLTGNGYAIAEDPVYRFVPRAVSASFDAGSGALAIDAGQDMAISYMMNSYQYRYNDKPLRLATVDMATRKHSFTTPLSGTVSGGGKIMHRVVDNHWVDFGGTCRTVISGGSAEVPAFAYIYYNADDGVYKSSPAYSGGTLSFKDTDITLEASITSLTLGVSDTQLWPKATLTVTANDMYVSAYELWMVPGSFKHGDVIKDPDFDHEDGHSKAFCVATVSADAPDSDSDTADGLPRTYSFDRLFDKSLMSHVDKDNNYMFYIKAIYRDDISAPQQARAISRAAGDNGLHPTFHGLMAPPTTTGVDDTEICDSRATVRAGQGYVEIAGTSGRVSVYNAQGMLLYSGSAGRVELPAGYYIVNTGQGASVKVRVS